jgi:hypothetical protein
MSSEKIKPTSHGEISPRAMSTRRDEQYKLTLYLVWMQELSTWRLYETPNAKVFLLQNDRKQSKSKRRYKYRRVDKICKKYTVYKKVSPATSILCF